MKRLPFALPAPPAWVTCPRCQQEVAPGPCPVCRGRAEVAAQRLTRERARGFPARYDWVDPRDPTLGAPPPTAAAPSLRVKPPVGRPDMRFLVASIVDDSRPTVTLYGPAGVGKTTMAVACAKLAPAAFFASCADLERAKGDAIGAHEGEPDMVRRARECRVLVLDDMGKEAGTRINPVPGILQARHDHQLRTYVTTGLEPPQVEARYDDGIRRRIFETTSALVIRWR